MVSPLCSSGDGLVLEKSAVRSFYSCNKFDIINLFKEVKRRKVSNFLQD